MDRKGAHLARGRFEEHGMLGISGASVGLEEQVDGERAHHRVAKLIQRNNL